MWLAFNNKCDIDTVNNDSNPHKLSVVKRFEFSSALQRMSVITHCNDNNSLVCFVKGSPEMIQNLSRDDSVPADFYSILEKYTEDGLRVLGMSYRVLEDFDQERIETCKREQIECDLTFIGFLVMENKIKKETFDCLTQLQKAEISCVMATGDNGLTAVSVGRQCGIIPTDKTVYLAETTKSKHDKKHLTWIKIEGRNKILSALKSTVHKSSLIKSSVMREKLSVRNLSHAGYQDSMLGKGKVV